MSVPNTSERKLRPTHPGEMLREDFLPDYGLTVASLAAAIVDLAAWPRAELGQRGVTNGVEGLELVDRAFAEAREPAVHCVAALYSPESGIVNAEELVKTLLRAGEAAGVIFLPGTRLLGADPMNGVTV